MKLLSFLAALSSLGLCTAQTSNTTSTAVATPLGTLRGKVVKPSVGVDVHAFLGVPFAEPPVGELRWNAPVSLTAPWDGERNATDYERGCFQPTYLPIFAHWPKDDQSEDCLYLNIYTPATARQDGNGLLPVIFFIHGGGFEIDSANVYDGTAFAATNKTVFVSVEYRLGIFGFFADPESGLAGNWGLLDQVEALNWVGKYIHLFGGDKDRLTAWGQSVGGVSAGCLALSPLGRGKVLGVVESSSLCSNSPTEADWPAVTQGAIAFSNATGCLDDDAVVDVGCLRNLTEQEIISTTQNLFPFGFAGPPGILSPVMNPVFDGVYYDGERTVEQLIEDGEYVVPHIISDTSGEIVGPLVLLTVQLDPPVLLVGPNKDLNITLSQLGQLLAMVGVPFETIGTVVEFYDAINATDDRRLGIFVDAIMDNELRGYINHADDLARHANVWFSRFSHITAASDMIPRIDSRQDAMHGTNLQYEYNFPNYPEIGMCCYYDAPEQGVVMSTTFDDAERALANAMFHALLSFVVTGDPNDNDYIMSWLSRNDGDNIYLFASNHSNQIGYRASQQQFWQSLYDESPADPITDTNASGSPGSPSAAPTTASPMSDGHQNNTFFWKKVVLLLFGFLF